MFSEKVIENNIFNVDVASPLIPFLNSNTNGIGMVMRNAEGELIATLMRIGTVYEAVKEDYTMGSGSQAYQFAGDEYC